MSNPGTASADAGQFSIDEAVAALDAADEKEEAAPEPVETAEQPNTEAEPAAEEAEEPETAIEGDEAETEEGEAEGDEPQLPDLEPPALWNAEDKKYFSELPRHLQERLLAKETEANRSVSLKIEEAAALRKAAEAEASRFSAISQKLDKLIPEAEQNLVLRWGEGEIDWNRVAQERGVDKAFELKNNYDRDQATIQQLRAAKNEVESVQEQDFVKSRFAELKTIAPALADDKEGPARQLALVNYLSQYGVKPEIAIRKASAQELLIGYKAFLYDQANDSAKSQSSNPKPAPKPAATLKPSVRATAAPARAGSPQNARLNTLMRKPSLTTDEAVELLDLQGT